MNTSLNQILSQIFGSLELSAPKVAVKVPYEVDGVTLPGCKVFEVNDRDEDFYYLSSDLLAVAVTPEDLAKYYIDVETEHRTSELANFVSTYSVPGAKLDHIRAYLLAKGFKVSQADGKEMWSHYNPQTGIITVFEGSEEFKYSYLCKSSTDVELLRVINYVW